MKKLIPLLIALLGLGTGVGAGMALRPRSVPEPQASACASSAPPAHAEAEAPAEPCAADPFAPEVAERTGEKRAEVSYAPIEKPFVVPVFAGERTVAMVVLSVSIATEGERGAGALEAVEPRLRDSFLKVMFRHANSGGFDGSYTAGRKIEDLKSALLGAAREVIHDAPVDEVLITEIARQDS